MHARTHIHSYVVEPPEKFPAIHPFHLHWMNNINDTSRKTYCYICIYFNYERWYTWSENVDFRWDVERLKTCDRFGLDEEIDLKSLGLSSLLEAIKFLMFLRNWMSVQEKLGCQTLDDTLIAKAIKVEQRLCSGSVFGLFVSCCVVEV